MKRALSEVNLQFYLKTIFEYNYKKTGWGILFQRWYFLVGWGRLNVLTETSGLDFIVSFTFIYLFPPALCTLLSITSSPSLPSHPWVGLNFSRKLYYLCLVQPHITLGSRCRPFCLLFYVLVFAFPPGILG